MGLKSSITKRWNWLTKVQFDKNTGFYVYTYCNNQLFIRHPKHFVEAKTSDWLSEKLYFNRYLPQSGDTVIDLGAGYGEETVYLASKSSKVNYFGIEIQPIIYECLCNTYFGLGETFQAFPYAISNEKEFLVKSQFSYASSGASEKGYIRIPCLSWEAFLEQNKIQTIDLLKMNIEGAEIHFLNDIKDFSTIKRIIISTHDFRANNGEGEQYRTKEKVLAVLKREGYQIQTFSYGISWADDWLYAEK